MRRERFEFVKETAFQFTLREMRATATSPRAWGVMAVIVLILGISGPFQTFQYFAFGPRLAYWAVMGVMTFGVGSFFATWASTAAGNFGFGKIAKFVFTGFVSGLAVAICVIAINILAMGNFYFDDLENMLKIAGYSIGISVAIVGLFSLFHDEEAKQNSSQPARILSRLPVEKRGVLISMSVQDHYVEVVTSRGKHLTLVRLSDAIHETEGTSGMQIHRSHWVAFDAIKSVTRQNGKTILLTTGNGELPVSRSYIKSLKEAGLLV